MSRLIPIGATLFVWSSFLLAQERTLIEEVIVTAQRVEESAQKVPIAVSAFDDAKLKDRQIILLSDLHINVPNVSFRPRTDSSQSHLRIRGIGWQDLGYGNETPSSTHVNEIPFPQSFASVEFYDLERVELMRGPQGTLFGRNATAGALNLVTKKPAFDAVDGYLELEYGNYDNRRAVGAINLPVGERLAFRVAATVLNRDGYVENKAADQIPGIDDDVDGRDYHAFRITGAWQINERAQFWLTYDRLDEDSDYLPSTIFGCRKSALPVGGGCDPNEFGLEGQHPGAVGLPFAMGLEGIIPLGARDADTGLVYRYPRPELEFREVHWEADPEWDVEEEIWAFGFDLDLDRWALSITGGHQDTEFRIVQSDSPFNSFQIGFDLGPSARNPSGIWPMSALPGSPKNLRDGPCPWDTYEFGVRGGCIADVDQTRFVARTVLHDQLEYWTLEAKLRSQNDGPLNFVLGGSYAHQKVHGFAMFLGNGLDMLMSGSLSALPPAYPAAFGTEKSGDEAEAVAVFGELYWQLTPVIKVTAGFRYNEDEKRPNQAGFGLNSIDVTFGFGPEPIWVRSTLLPYVFGGPPSDEGVALADFYRATDAIANANNFGELISALQLVPPVERPGERRAITGRPAQLRFEEWSGRFVVDWSVRPDMLVYAKYNRGFKPGGFGIGDNRDFDSEIIDSFEVGFKARLFGDSLSLNAAAFLYDYKDMQVSPGAWQLEALNVDVEGRGVELDLEWHPPFAPGLSLNLAYGFLDTELADYFEIDGNDQSQGDPDYVVLRDTFVFGGSYIARLDEVLPLAEQALLDGGAIGENRAPGTSYPNGIPAYFSRAYLEANGVDTLFGLLVNMRGNSLPNSPKHNFSVGAAYSWFFASGTVTARTDYYWQNDAFSSVFNSRGDKIDAWGQLNASVVYESANEQWVARLWARNLLEEDNIIAKTNRSQFAFGEPRVYGLSVRYNIGG